MHLVVISLGANPSSDKDVGVLDIDFILCWRKNPQSILNDNDSLVPWTKDNNHLTEMSLTLCNQSSNNAVSEQIIFK